MEGSVINYHLMRLRLSDTAIDSLYFISFIRGAKTVTDYIREVNHGVTRDGINTIQLLNLPIAVPPLAEQAQIVAEVEASLSNIAKLEEATENNLKRAEHERQSILQEAFAGRLVSQDPQDEPASVLLERIREERKKREEVEQLRRRENNIAMAQQRKKRKNIAPFYDVLVEAGGKLTPEELYTRSEEQPKEKAGQEREEEFYIELDAEVAADLIIEERLTIDEILLHAVKQGDGPLEVDEESTETDTISAGERRKARELPLPNLEELPKGERRKAREEVKRPLLWDE